MSRLSNPYERVPRINDNEERKKYLEEKPYAAIGEVMEKCDLDCSKSTVRNVMKSASVQQIHDDKKLL